MKTIGTTIMLQECRAGSGHRTRSISAWKAGAPPFMRYLRIVSPVNYDITTPSLKDWYSASELRTLSGDEGIRILIHPECKSGVQPVELHPHSSPYGIPTRDLYRDRVAGTSRLP